MKHKTKAFWVNLGLLAVLVAYTYVFIQPLTSGALQNPPLNCSAYTQGYEDFCFFKKSEPRGNNDLGYSVSMCQRIKQDYVSGHCMVNIAWLTALGGDLNSSMGICSMMDDGPHKNDCFFRLAEEAGRLDGNYTRPYNLCRRSGDFEYDCVGHLEEQVHEKSEENALSFCSQVARDYENVSDTPIVYCYHHFGLRVGRKQISACEKMKACEAADEYKRECIRGVITVTNMRESDFDKC